MKPIEKIRLQDDFYLHINSLWFCDSKNKLVGKNSPRVKLQSDVLKELLLQTKKLVVKPNKTEDEEKLSMIWTASLKSLNPWILRNIKYDNIILELKRLDSYIYVGCGVEQIAKYLHYSKTIGVGNILNFFCANNFENSQQMSLTMSVSGLSLPSKEYYENESFEVQRKLFIEHLNQIFKLGLAHT